MKRPTIKPRRPLRNDLYSLVVVLALPVVLGLIFPFEATSFRPSDDAPDRPSSCAFITLSDDEAARVMANARTAWRVTGEGVRGLRVDLSVETMPDEPHGATMRITERMPLPTPNIQAPGIEPLPPTKAAPAATKIPSLPESTDVPSAFSRQELLKLD